MQDNQTELETTAAANDTSCSCPSARELAVTRFQQARAFAAAKVNQIRKAATEQASTICDYAQEKGEVIRDKAKKFHEAGAELGVAYTKRTGAVFSTVTIQVPAP